ncbi:MAG: tRNA uridine-5-carboxymethylaminomethyl(34) synthesis enzyme MnmG [Gammaproteobacteria bacterium]|nr:tRNA uridine-5-carboxymethylaminomethyl(34) synthesis enzyme MnmG [Gammaproteobacteria bacterium]
MKYPTAFDVIVIGGGHAGVEAALASARVGASTLLLTQAIETIGQMSCNPAIGGIGKSHLVREIDALGGTMAIAADQAGIHFRTLNNSKGPAVRATRAQADRVLYRNAIRQVVERQPNLTIYQDMMVDLTLKSDRIVSVSTRLGMEIEGGAVVLTTGTFLGGRIFVGSEQHTGGRAGDPASLELSEKLRTLPLAAGRLKTGTPPRIDGSSVDFTKLEEQPGDEPRPVMSFLSSSDVHPRQISCHITHTNPQTHEVIRRGLDRSPMFSGDIEGVGPRYCPSIEDKIVRFAERDQHQIFVEPEGLQTTELYPNGISTSLSFDIQYEAVRTIRGFENAHITRPGYAIEYDFFDPRGLMPSLETKSIENLFFAGQINGTTGYEEAAAQGLVAGLNAARKVAGQTAWVPQRHEAYIGVLIDDLTTMGANEPYRMFTSRAEYRLRLRQDNADLRLTPVGRELGLVTEDRFKTFVARRDRLDKCNSVLAGTTVYLNSDLANKLSKETGEAISRDVSLLDFAKRPGVRAEHLTASGVFTDKDEAYLVQALIDVKYQGYLRRQDQAIERSKEQMGIKLPIDMEFEGIDGLSNELREKLEKVRPSTLGKAASIPGMTPAALSLLSVHAKRHSGLRKTA